MKIVYRFYNFKLLKSKKEEINLDAKTSKLFNRRLNLNILINNQIFNISFFEIIKNKSIINNINKL